MIGNERLGMTLRLVGVAIVLACLVVYDSESSAFINRLLVPITAAAGAWFMIRNTAAVCLAASMLAMAHCELDSSDWVVSVAYPTVAAVCGASVLVIVINRFSKRIRTTHDIRWQHRNRDPKRKD